MNAEIISLLQKAGLLVVAAIFISYGIVRFNSGNDVMGIALVLLGAVSFVVRELLKRK